MIYIFDVDGTLTPPSKPMEKDFQNFFIEWAGYNNFVVVSGSHYKTIERQLGKTIISLAQSTFPCSGLVQYQGFRPVWEYEHTFSKDLYNSLDKYLKQSNYSNKTGLHIDDRGSLINFSIVGRGDDKYREHYNEWDMVHREREEIVRDIERNFDVSVTIGGQISVDITPKNWGKHKILDHLTYDDEFTFFGDKTNVGGNDYSIFQELKNSRHIVHTVKDYKNTEKLLRGNHSR